jgi:ABC-2 type transport system ATP-binding protein
MSQIEVREIAKSFADKKAVADLSFSVSSGSIFGLLGPNGAGKTTTIRMLMSITIPDRGEILFDGAAMHEARKREIGYLPEERGLYPKMKVQSVVEFFAALKGMSPRSAKTAIDYWFGRFEIDSWRTKKLEELSKGMQQKVQFITTILHDPPIVILDEPFSGLDPVNVDLLRDIVLELKEKGKIVIFSTHVMEKAEQLCDEILLINDGRVILEGSLEAIRGQFSENIVDFAYTGDTTFINDFVYVDKVISEAGKGAIYLNRKGVESRLLREASANLDIQYFAPRRKTLHEIFVAQVGGEANV